MEPSRIARTPFRELQPPGGTWRQNGMWLRNASCLPAAMATSIPDVPPPWQLEGECYWMILKPLKTVPPAAYAPLEQPRGDDPTDKTQKFLGGLGTVWIVRYSSSPAGAFTVC